MVLDGWRKFLQRLKGKKVDPISCLCAQTLAAVARPLGAEPVVEHNRLRLGREVLEMAAIIEQESRPHSRYAIGLAVTTGLQGTAPLTAGSVGLGSARDDALQTAVSEWAALAGLSWLGALGLKTDAEPAFQAGNFSVHPGLTGIRAQNAPAWSQETQARLAALLTTRIEKLALSPQTLHSLALMFVVESKVVKHGECRVDGVICPDTLEALQAFDWPEGSETYMLKQHCVLRPT